MMFAALFALFIISGNVHATGKEAIVVSGLENMMDAKLELENWMVEDTYWVKAEKVQEMEESLQLESWMTDQNNWNVPVYATEIVETEKQLEIEEWMTSRLFWN